MRNFIVKAATVVATAVTIGVPALAVQPDAPAGKPMTRAELQAMVSAGFARFDTNRDGAVTRAEYDAARVKMREERQSARFARRDANGDGQISREEFAEKGAKDRGKGMHRGGHRGGGRGGLARLGMFEAMDANKDGRVTLAEATARPLAMFDAADADRNGTVTSEERRAAHARMRAEWQARRR